MMHQKIPFIKLSLQLHGLSKMYTGVKCVFYMSFPQCFFLNFVAQVGYSMFKKLGIYFSKTQKIFHSQNFEQVTQ
jgi:hypothetical protein